MKPIVARDRSERGKYLLLDGHLRIEILKDTGEIEAVCLISTDDEAFTYNRRVNRIAIVKEHRMILKAIERGVSEERIARALNVNVSDIPQRFDRFAPYRLVRVKKLSPGRFKHPVEFSIAGAEHRRSEIVAEM